MYPQLSVDNMSIGDISIRYKYLRQNYPNIDKVWAAHYILKDWNSLVDSMQTTYQNIALISALTSGFIISLALQPSFNIEHKAENSLKLVSVTGILAFGCLLASVIDSILIDNSICLLSNGGQILSFIKDEYFLLLLPVPLLIIGQFFVCVNICLTVYLIYGRLSSIISFSILGIGGLFLLRRYIRIKIRMEQFGTETMAKLKELYDDGPL